MLYTASCFITRAGDFEFAKIRRKNFFSTFGLQGKEGLSDVTCDAGIKNGKIQGFEEERFRPLRRRLFAPLRSRVKTHDQSNSNNILGCVCAREETNIYLERAKSCLLKVVVESLFPAERRFWNTNLRSALLQSFKSHRWCANTFLYNPTPHTQVAFIRDHQCSWTFANSIQIQVYNRLSLSIVTLKSNDAQNRKVLLFKFCLLFGSKAILL